MIEEHVLACDSCSLSGSCRSPVPGRGVQTPHVMLVGEAPGKKEDEVTRPFAGQAGQLLDGELEHIGFPRSACYVTNVVKCRPPNNRDPKPAEVAACSKWLQIEIGMMKPKILVAMGATAIKAIIPEAGSVEHLHGKPIRMNGMVVLPTYHPAAALHDTAKLRQLYDDFQVLKGLLNGKQVEDFNITDQYPDPKYYEIEDDADADKLQQIIESYKQCALDVETVDDELWSIQISVEEGESYFVPKHLCHHFNSFPGFINVIVHNYLHDSKFVRMPRFTDTMTMAYLLGHPQGLKELASRLCGVEMQSYSELVSPGGYQKAMHYLEQASCYEWPPPEPVIDMKWDNKAGKVVKKTRNPKPIISKIKRIIADAMDNPEIDPYSRWNNIDARERVHVEAKFGLMPQSTLEDIDHHDAVQYSCRDSDVTLRCYNVMMQQIHELELDFVLHGIDLAVLPMVSDMMDNGWPIDKPYMQALSAEYTVRMKEEAEKVAKAGGRAINPGSSPQVADLVYGDLGFTPTKRTKTGLISTDDRELVKVNHPVIRPILEYRRLAKNRDSFSDALVSRAVDTEDLIPEWVVEIAPTSEMVSRIHTTLKTTRVETGRLSSSNPNLQAMPTRTKEGKRIRRGFIFSPGYIGMRADYSQQEMKVMAHEARCKFLIDLFLSGQDAHTSMAARIFDLSMDAASASKYRYPTKRLNFGVIYGITAEGLAADIEEHVAELNNLGEGTDIVPWTVAECDELITDWYKLCPEVKDFRMRKVAQARRYGYVTDMFGRIRYIPELLCPIRHIREAGARQAGNMPIQGGSAGITKLAMAAMWRSADEFVRFLMQIHDEIVMEVPDVREEIHRYAQWMKRVMESVVNISIPLTVDVKAGYRWTEMEDVV